MAQEKPDSIVTDSINLTEKVENPSSKSSGNSTSGNQNVDNLSFVSVLLISAGVSAIVGMAIAFFWLFKVIKPSNIVLVDRIEQRKRDIKSLKDKIEGLEQKIARLELNREERRFANSHQLGNPKAEERKPQNHEDNIVVALPRQDRREVLRQEEPSKTNSAPVTGNCSKEQNEDSETIKKVKTKRFADSPGEGGDVFRDVFSSPKNSSMFVITYCEGETTGEFTLMDSPAAIKRFIDGIDVHSKNTANYVGSGMTINQDLTVPGTVELTPDKKWQIKEKMNLKFE